MILDEIIVFCFGLIIGSFTNVIIWRMPRGESIIFPPSHCPACGKRIKGYDNIPVLSYLLLSGKCRNCGTKISIRYPLIELTMGVLFVVTYLRYGLSMPFHLAGGLFISANLFAISMIDLKYYIIPDSLNIVGLAVGLLLGHWLLPGRYPGLNSFLSAIGGAAFFYLLGFFGEKILKREALGGGDIKMIAFLGAFLGWRKTIMAIFLSALIGTVVSVIVMLFSKKFRKKRLLPYGPFIAIGGWIAYMWGESIITWYLDTIFSKL